MAQIPLSERYPYGFQTLKRARLEQLLQEVLHVAESAAGELTYCTACHTVGREGYACGGCEDS